MIIRDFIKDIDKYNLLDEVASEPYFDEASEFEDKLEDNMPLTDDEVLYIMERAKKVKEPSESWSIIADGIYSAPNKKSFSGFLLLDVSKLNITSFATLVDYIYDESNYITEPTALPNDINFKQEPDKFVQIAVTKQLTLNELLFLIHIVSREPVSEKTLTLLGDFTRKFLDLNNETYNNVAPYSVGLGKIKQFAT